MNRALLIFAACCLLSDASPALAWDPAYAPTCKPEGEMEQCQLVKVTDGDTVKLQGPDGKGINVRLIGVDTEELKSGTARAFGAAALVAELLEDAQAIWIERDVDAGKDAFDRELAWIWVDVYVGPTDRAFQHGASQHDRNPPQRRLVQLELLAAGLADRDIFSTTERYDAELGAALAAVEQRQNDEPEGLF